MIGNRLVDALVAQVVELTHDGEGEEQQEPFAPAKGEIFAFSTLFSIHDELEEDPILAYAASADPDTLYYHEAMREPDADQFREAMVKEFVDQWRNENFVLRCKSEIPEDARVLPSVWAMKRKRKVLTGEVYKHKARLNLDGSKQIADLDYHMTYSPTVSWPAVRLQLALVLVNNWYTKQIDFVQAFPQAPIQKVQYMRIPKGIEIEGVDDADEWVLELHKNIYGGCDAGRQWYLHLKAKLESIGFVRSLFDECVFYKGKCMYVLYTDDSILAGPDKDELEAILQQIQDSGLGITDEGDIADFLGVNIQRTDGEFHLTQPKLIDSILEDLRLDGDRVSTKDIPMKSSKLLSRHPDSPDFDQHFNYRRVVGKLNFLEQSTRGDISYATHMLARFCTCPKKEHGEAAKWLGRYLLKTRDKGLIMRPDPSRGLELYCDADFAGAWDPELAGEDMDTARSRHGYIITYAGVPLLWKSQMQGEIALSSTESELIGLSAGLRTTIPLQHILNEMKQLGFDIVPNGPVIQCTAFEDNNGALAIASVPKMRPRTKHINTKYFHFVEYNSRKDAPFSWRRKHPEVYASKILTHCSVVGMSRALKIEKLDQEHGLQNMRDILALNEDASPYIVDIAPASHAATTGVTYVQYLQPHKEVVLAAVQEYINSCPYQNPQFPDGPILVDGGTSQSPTLQDGTVQSSPPTVAPGRFDSIVANTPASSVQSRPSRQSIPTSIDFQVRSYSDALRSSMSGPRQSSEGDISDCGTVTTGNTSSKKSAREVELESENAELKAIIYDLKASHNVLSNELSTIKSLLQSMSMSGMSFAPPSVSQPSQSSPAPQSMPTQAQVYTPYSYLFPQQQQPSSPSANLGTSLPVTTSRTTLKSPPQSSAPISQAQSPVSASPAPAPASPTPPPSTTPAPKQKASPPPNESSVTASQPPPTPAPKISTQASVTSSATLNDEWPPLSAPQKNQSDLQLTPNRSKSQKTKDGTPTRGDSKPPFDQAPPLEGMEE